jgi:hypothetical protein
MLFLNRNTITGALFLICTIMHAHAADSLPTPRSTQVRLEYLVNGQVKEVFDVLVPFNEVRLRDARTAVPVKISCPDPKRAISPPQNPARAGSYWQVSASSFSDGTTTFEAKTEFSSLKEVRKTTSLGCDLELPIISSISVISPGASGKSPLKGSLWTSKTDEGMIEVRFTAVAQ